jgi:hypothetical protein
VQPVAHDADREMDFARRLLRRQSDRIKPRLQGIERRNQLRRRRPCRREGIEQIEQVGIRRPGTTCTAGCGDAAAIESRFLGEIRLPQLD